MAHVVRRAEHVADRCSFQRRFVALVVGIGDGGHVGLEGSEVGLVHHIFTHGIVRAADGAGHAVDVGVGDEVLAILIRHLLPVPPGDDFIQGVAVVVVVHPYLLNGLVVCVLGTNLHLLTGLVDGVVGVEVGLHVQQLQLTAVGGGDGQRQVDGLRVGRGGAGIGRHLLVVDVHLALHVPVMGG